MITDSVEPEEKQVGYFLDAEAQFKEAAEALPPRTVHIALAGSRIALHFASPGLEACILPAVEHLVCGDSGEPDFTIGLWDAAATGVSMPPPPCGRQQFTDRGDIWGFNSSRIRLAFIYGEYSVNLYDRESRWGLYWVPDTKLYPYWSKASPLRPLFHWCMEQAGNQLVHGAAVGEDGHAVLLTGKGGIGKSTTSLECLTRGMQFAGDDYVVLTPGPEPMVYPLYATAKVNPGEDSRFDTLACHTMHTASLPGEKSVFKLYPALKEQISRPMKLSAVMLPEITGERDSHIENVHSRYEVKHEASFTTVCQLPRAGQPTIDFFHRLVETVPSYRLKLGTDAEQTCELLRRCCRDGDVSGAASPPPVGERLPRVTAIIPVYNRQHFIRDAVESIIAQDYPSLELIIVDDGSDDETVSVIRSLPYDIRILHQPNEGPAAARNRGIRNATGELIAFLDSDDLWPEGSLHVLVNELMKDPDLMVAKGHNQLSKFNPSTGQYELEGNPGESFPNSVPGSLFRAEVFQAVGLLDTELQFGEDTDWFNRARELGQKVKWVNMTSLIVRRHYQNMTHGKTTTELGALRVFKKALDRQRQMD